MVYDFLLANPPPILFRFLAKTNKEQRQKSAGGIPFLSFSLKTLC